MTFPSRIAALLFTLATIVAGADALFTGFYLPWPKLTIAFSAAAAYLAVLTAAEWTALRTRHHVAPVATGHGGRRSAARS
ncbi:hypothetical protein ACFVJK_46850 [Streptomyces sp. NPDC127172]|uniref:hypothetical protein n=1 Tax=Streptomyces sp. NPDC127172 TaxID=3345382 RepID=UPI003640610D